MILCKLENHHLIQATNGAFDISAAYNDRWLWPKKNSADALTSWEPYHGNAPEYTQIMEWAMDDAYQQLPTGPSRSQAASQALMDIIQTMNSYIDLIGALSAFINRACQLG